MFLKFTNTKISNNHKLLQPLSPFVAYHPHMMTLKPPHSTSICSSNSLKLCDYGMAPYIFSLYCKSFQVNPFARLFI